MSIQTQSSTNAISRQCTDLQWMNLKTSGIKQKYKWSHWLWPTCYISSTRRWEDSGCLCDLPGLVETALESSPEELWLELLRFLLLLSGRDTLAEVVLVTNGSSTDSWVFTAALLWMEKRRKSPFLLAKWHHGKHYSAAKVWAFDLCITLDWIHSPCCHKGLILLLLLHFLAKPLTAAQLLAAFYGSFIIRYDCSDSLLKEGREPQCHTVNLEWRETHKNKP